MAWKRRRRMAVLRLAILVFLVVVAGWMVPLTTRTRMQLSTLQVRLDVDVAAAAAVNNHDKDDTSSSSSSSWWRQTNNLHSHAVRDHPHQGARCYNDHTNGTILGMVVDPSIHRLQDQVSSFFWKNSMAACPPSDIGIEGETGHVVLQRIRDEGYQSQVLPTNTTTITTRSAPKILCLVYTIHTLDGSNHNLDAIVRTWGRQCDGFIAASNLTNHTQGSIDLPHQGPETYGNMFQKIRSIWTYAYDHYLDEFDYFYICGDDTYVLMEHMRQYLHSDQIRHLQEGYLDAISSHFANTTSQDGESVRRATSQRPRPLLLGTPLMHNGGNGFPVQYPVIAGGSGYILNRAALQLWGEKGADSFKTQAVDSREDFYMGRFFQKQGVFVSGSQDEEGGFYFGQSGRATYGTTPGHSPILPHKLRSDFGMTIHSGPDFVSRRQISFHLKRDRTPVQEAGFTLADLMYRYHAFFHDLCP